MAVAKDLYPQQQNAVDPENPASNEIFDATKANAVRDKIYELIDELALYSLVGHNHDDRYFTETEINNFFEGESAGKKQVHWDRVTNKPATFTPTAHTHVEANITDLDKYSQAEIDAFFEGEASGKKQVHYDRITNKPATFPATAHNHDDLYFTEAEINAFFEGTDSGKQQIHWDRVVNKPTLEPPYVSILDFSPTADGITDDRVAMDAAQDAAEAIGGSVFIPANTEIAITGEQYANQVANRIMYYFRVPVIGESLTSSILRYKKTSGDERGFRVQSPTSVERAQRNGIAATQTRAILNEQIAGLNQVTCATPADASNFSVGQSVRVCAGKDIYDADDPLWIFDQIFTILSVNGTTGVITLDTNVPKRLSANGFLGQTINTWTANTGYSKGDWVDTGNTGSVYEALTTGTSANVASVLDDTGVSWKRVTTDRGSLTESQEDYRPIIQLVTDPIQDVFLQNLTLETDGNLINLFSVRNARNSGLKNVILRGQCAFPLGAAEGATKVLYEDIILDTAQHITFDDSFARVFSGYSATVTLRNVRGRSGKGIDARGIFAESFCEVNIEGGEFNCTVPGATNTYGILSSGGIFNIKGATFNGFKDPIRRNQAAETGFADRTIDPHRPRIATFTDVSGNVFSGMSAKSFRNVGADVRKVYNERNRYILVDTFQSGNIQHPTTVEFNSFMRSNIWFEFVPTEAADDTWIDIGPSFINLGDKIEDIKKFHYVILSHSVFFNNPPASTQVTSRIRANNSGTTRFIFSNNSSNNDVIVSDTQRFNELTQGDGGGVRYFDPLLETLQHTYFFTGTDGGAVRVMIEVLVAER